MIEQIYRPRTFKVVHVAKHTSTGKFHRMVYVVSGCRNATDALMRVRDAFDLSAMDIYEAEAHLAEDATFFLHSFELDNYDPDDPDYKWLKE